MLAASTAVVLAAAGTLTALALVNSGDRHDSLTPPGSAPSNSSPGRTAQAGDTSSARPVSGTITGAGSTFQASFQDQAGHAFQLANPNVTVNYSPVGSGTGLAELTTGAALFAGRRARAAS